MPDHNYQVKIVLNNLNLVKKFSQIVRSEGGFELLDPNDYQKTDLLIYELGEKPENDLDLLQTLIQQQGMEEVFLTAESADSGTLMQVMRLGIKEFFTHPIDEKEVKNALARFKERKQAPSGKQLSKSGQVISIFGSKGGVGTTTVAVNLAISMAQGETAQSVALIDMNTLFGEIPLFLEMSPKFHWGEITKNIDRLDDTFLANILTPHRSGIQVLPSPAYLNGHIRPTPEIMTRLLAMMRRMFDYVIIDGGQSTNDTSLKVLEISDKLLLITILSLPCLANTNKLMRSLSDLGYVDRDRIKVVLNRYMKKGDISLKDAEAGIGTTLFRTIPNDYGTTMMAINNGQPLVSIAPKTPIARSFTDLAASLSAQPETKAKKKWKLF
ncbi:MAG: AAA family ATPase [Deltaproteobacteria bacterium]|jgi:pilus assembly protein CpaE|nr:AAA family ATPase [Deltaproteobacteria bacterium]